MIRIIIKAVKVATQTIHTYTYVTS